MKCVTGLWLDTLDDEDREAFKQSIGRVSRAELYAAICAANGGSPYGLTALKQHLNFRCICK